ncbi:uncharacterized protein LOC112456671 [Temnothorax curvispinosus]|uniref:Uncharacterized protein LOC112456671 n=1 Tax=Temnothorax curvispinosus TaxID=300111 RepID=A0A6J1Q0A8_9HYME|nr:uncharacterized protein LOC112456671 [Temnothorax curvispinosus]
MEHFEKTTTRNVDGRFIVRLPIKETKLQQLGESRSTALKRFIAMERKLQKQPQLKAQYAQFMSEYLALGHMVRIDEQQIPQQAPRYYIPHHYVLKDSSLTTKLRVVFDASCDTSTGISLNDCLMVGPTLQQDLFMILLRFRTFVYVITADITQMYRQVLIDEAQIFLQMIFWRNDPKDEISLFALLTVIYGSAAAAFLAIASIKKIATLERINYPIGAAAILDDFYVDDLLSGTDTIAGVKQIRDETTKILSKAGFQLRKWASNCPEVLEDMSSADTGEPIHFINRNEEICTLGMHWNTSNDSFKYDINISDSRKVTKRSMLSALSKIFDPLGLLGPITLVAKILIQRVWKHNLAWDETVPMDIHTAWLQFQDQLSIIHNFTIPRYVLCKQASRIQIHGFADASEKAYGACLYVRITNPQGQHSTQLLCSKSRVAPLKTITLPRLELSAAVLLVQLADKALKSVRLEIEDVGYWTDSEIVLQWIRATNKRWSVFVANRVGEIHRLSRPTQWYHVSSEFNPADYVSRGSFPASLSNASLWWSGPSWLQHEAQDWNTNIPPLLGEIPEQRPTLTSIVTIDDKHEIFTRFSSLNKLIRVIALCIRFITNIRSKPESRIKDRLTTQELFESNRRLIRIIQQSAFKQELHSLKANGCVSRKSKLLSLAPFIDEQDIIRVGGRLRNSAISPDKKHPVVLPADHPFTRLVIAHEHRKQLHAGAQTTLAAVRDKYWPLSARNSIKKHIRQCITCYKAAPRTSETIMSELPSYTVTPSKPFAHSGVDYCGPIHIKSSQLRNAKLVKTYIAIFVCLCTKAVHIELVSSLSTEAFLNALKRFIARRGKVSCIYSDNGTNFQGAANSLKEFYQLLHNKHHQDTVDTTLKEDNIEWSFIPPHAPHFGGIWEAAVKSAKNHLKRVVGDAALTFEEMYTVLAQIEAVMNSRPLTPISNDPNDLSYLTPGHFLVGDSLTSTPQQDVSRVPINRLSRWQRINQIYQHFWKRWSCEYLQQLQQRTKWRYSKGLQLTTGDMVMIREDDSSPLKWTVGRIENIYPGADGIARVASIKTIKGTYKRPITKLCILPLQKED